MGQKVNAIGFRVGINKQTDSRWYAERDFADKLHEDIKITQYIKKTLNAAGVSKVVIERPNKKASVTIHAARPGVVIGKKGADIDKIKKDLAKFTKDEVNVNILPVPKPELESTLVAESVAQQLEKRVAFRRAMKRAVQSCLRLGALGIRINVSGRLGGAEIAVDDVEVDQDGGGVDIVDVHRWLLWLWGGNATLLTGANSYTRWWHKHREFFFKF